MDPDMDGVMMLVWKICIVYSFYICELWRAVGKMMQQPRHVDMSMCVKASRHSFVTEDGNYDRG